MSHRDGTATAPAGTDDLSAVVARVEALLAGLQDHDDPSVGGRAGEVARLLVELYGAALERLLAGLVEPGVDGAARLRELAADRLVASVLILHGLHPDPVEERIIAALERVRPALGLHAGGVEFLGIDPDGVARLRLEGSCHGCPSSLLTVRSAIERAVLEAAPEVVRLDVDGVTAEPEPDAATLHQIAAFRACPTELADATVGAPG